MKALVLGGNGQLGGALNRSRPLDADVVGLARSELDIVSIDALRRVCQRLRPDVIVNAAAYTAVDLAESEATAATAVNVEGARNVAEAAKDIGARLIHMSTDFVFDGRTTTPYTSDAKTNPLSVYGRTKRDGEIEVLQSMPQDAAVVRTAWLYGRSGKNFVTTMLRLMADRDSLSVVADQRGTPTWVDSLASTVWTLASAQALHGIFHWTDGGEASWHEFAVAIQKEAISLGLIERAIPIHAIPAASYTTAAVRPRYSVLDCRETCIALSLQQRPWRVNLREMLKGVKS